MKDYRVEKVVIIRSGKIRLDENQAKRRVYAIKAVRPKGVYEILEPVQFKLGEVIGLPKIDKGQGMMLTDLTAEAEAKAKAKAEAEK